MSAHAFTMNASYIDACYALGFEPAMQMMLEAPELFTAVCERRDAGARRRMRQLAEAGAEAVFIADSWASCDIISPAMFEQFALPYQRSMVNAAREAGLKAVETMVQVARAAGELLEHTTRRL